MIFRTPYITAAISAIATLVIVIAVTAALKDDTTNGATVGTSTMAEPPLACEGYDPDWYLTLAGPDAQFTYGGRKLDVEVPQSSIAEGHDWPRAYTLLANSDTAIVVINQTSCTSGNRQWPVTAHILTQRGQSPILLTGCCTVAE